MTQKKYDEFDLEMGQRLTAVETEVKATNERLEKIDEKMAILMARPSIESLIARWPKISGGFATILLIRIFNIDMAVIDKLIVLGKAMAQVVP
jgi:hypothetical protein